jgi:hypothetical protein
MAKLQREIDALNTEKSDCFFCLHCFYFLLYLFVSFSDLLFYLFFFIHFIFYQKDREQAIVLEKTERLKDRTEKATTISPVRIDSSKTPSNLQVILFSLLILIYFIIGLC